jgi:DNA-binding response OmpR family regulator
MLPRVLIVEESLPYRRVLREALMSFRHCEVDDTPSAESAFEMALKREYALLLIALPLQPFSGEILDRLIAKAYPFAHPGTHTAPPVIYLLRPSEVSHIYDLQRDARVRGHLTIPPKLDTLITLTQNLLPPLP